MAYKTNYELWNPALTSRRPSQMSDIDVILSQTYPHVAMLPYMQCLHCNPIELEEPYSPSSHTTMSTFASSEDGSDNLTSPMVDKCKRRKIRQRLRQLLKRAARSHN